MAHIPQVGMYQEERQISDPVTDLVADVIDIAGVHRLAVDAAVVLPPLASVAINDAGAGATEASVKTDGIAVTAGSLLVGGKDAAGDQYALRVNASGQLVVSVGGSTPGATVGPTVADTAVGIGATVALPFIGTATRQTIQNTTVASLLRTREVGGPAGSGHLLFYGASITLGGEDGAMAGMEVENVGAVASSASVIFEGP